MHKTERHDAIIAILNAERITRQEQLANLLNQQGFGVTQSSVSRDLEELGVVKSGRFYAVPAKTVAPGYGEIKFKRAGDNLIVVRCQSGLASAIAVRIDSANVNDIVGTIAGDDTIFVAVENGAAQRSVIGRLTEIL